MSESLSTTTAEYQKRILAVLVHIQQNLDDDLPLDKLAAIAHLSPFHFHRVFSGLVGEGVKEHVRRLRLERAAHRLKFTDDQIVRIALDAGYQAHESFTRAFAAMFQMSPSQFRTEHRSVDYPPTPSGIHFSLDAENLHLPLPNRTNMPLQFETLPTHHVAFIRHTGPYDSVGLAWGKLMGWAGRRGLLRQIPAFFGLCYDDTEVTPPDKVRYDACLVVGRDIQPEGEIGIQEIQGGDFATLVHIGPYHTLGSAYVGMCGELAAIGNRMFGDPPAVEFYLNDPRSTPPERLRTKICLRLESRL